MVRPSGMSYVLAKLTDKADPVAAKGQRVCFTDALAKISTLSFAPPELTVTASQDSDAVQEIENTTDEVPAYFIILCFFVFATYYYV